MIEESYVRLYSNDFVRMAMRADADGPDPAVSSRRIGEARTHAVVMDARKGEGHLAALAERLREEARRLAQPGRFEVDPDTVGQQQDFLTSVADELERDQPQGPARPVWSIAPRAARA